MYDTVRLQRVRHRDDGLATIPIHDVKRIAIRLALDRIAIDRAQGQ